jgi:hypothetical protein
LLVRRCRDTGNLSIPHERSALLVKRSNYDASPAALRALAQRFLLCGGPIILGLRMSRLSIRGAECDGAPGNRARPRGRNVAVCIRATREIARAIASPTAPARGDRIGCRLFFTWAGRRLGVALVAGFRNRPAGIFEVGQELAVLSVFAASAQRDPLCLLG